MSNLLTSEQLRFKLKTRILTKVAEGSGIAYQTLYRFANDKSAQLKQDDALKLIKFLDEN